MQPGPQHAWAEVCGSQLRSTRVASPALLQSHPMGRLLDRITIDPDKRGGKPCIRGLRITVYDVLECLASEMSQDALLADFPDLERDDVRAVLQFAAERERRLSATRA